MGIGNEMRGDDSVGPLIIQKLSSLFSEMDNIVSLDGGTVPENYTGLIRKENPTNIIFVDAVDMKKTPGYIRIVDKDEIGNYSISTHAMPLSFLIKYLESVTDANMILIGIQPKNMDMTQDVSKEVEKSVEKVVGIFSQLLP
ncbi:MAG TPA: hydrogenase maturation peptidase HycI [Methanobacterium sp.]